MVGVGARDAADPDACRRAIGRVARQLARRKTVATTLPQIAGSKDQVDAVQATVEGVILGSYRFERYKSKKDGDARRLSKVRILGSGKVDAKAGKEAIRRGQVVAESQIWARDLVNTPALDLPPAELAKQAQAMAKELGLACKVWTEPELKKGGFGGVLGVGQGSSRPPRLIELRYAGGGRGAPIALTGKGIAFDSGGLSIKDATQMEWMKSDMGGAASILGTMRAIALLKPKVNVIAAIPSAENMPSGSAIRPGDVLTHRGGKTSEVLNTDAEGRLVLADALAFLAEKKPRVIVDTATLTGACMVGLGDDLWGAMGNDRDLIRDVLAAGEAAGEPGWELPMYEPYRKLIDSEIADIKNIGKRYGRRDHRCDVPARVRRRRAVGAPRHRRAGVRRTRGRLLAEGRDRRPRPYARPVRAVEGGRRPEVGDTRRSRRSGPRGLRSPRRRRDLGRGDAREVVRRGV